MARGSNATAEVEEVETVEAPVAEESKTEPKAKKEPARGQLPEGFVTPVGFAKILTEKELHTDRNGGHEVKPQMVYSYIKNAPKDDVFPLQTIKDDLGHDRQALSVEEGLAWWTRKNERTATRAANAQAKEAKKAEAAAKKESGSSETVDAQVTEAE